MLTQNSVQTDSQRARVITTRMLERLFSNGYLIVHGNMLAAVIITAIAWNYYSFHLTTGWLILFTAVIGVRSLHTRWYFGHIQDDINLSLHVKFLYVSVLLTGLCWLLGVTLFSGNLPIELFSLQLFVITTLSAISVITLSGSVFLFLLFNFPIFTAVMFVILQQEQVAPILAPVILILYLFLILFVAHLRRNFLARVALEVKNTELISSETRNREQQSMFERAEELGQLGHWEWDEIADKLVYCSRQFAALFDKTAEEMLGKSSSYILNLVNIHPADRERVYKEKWKAFETAKTMDIRFRVIRPSGVIRYLHQLGEFVTDVKGRVVRSFGTIQDITGLIESQAHLEKQQIMFKQAEELGRIGHWEWDEINDRLVSCSEQYAAIHEMSTEECIAASSSHDKDIMYVHPDDQERYKEYVSQAKQAENSVEIQYRLVTGRQNIRYVNERITLIRDDEGNLVRSFGTIQDITDRVEISNRLEETQARFSSAFKYAPVGMAMVDNNGMIMEINRAGGDMIGYTPKELTGRCILEFTHPDEIADNTRELQELFSGVIDYYNLVKRYQHRDGYYIWVDMHCSLVNEPTKNRTYMIIQSVDISKQRDLSEKLKYQASHDSLTDLINRREFETRLQRLIDNARSRESTHAFLYMDLDQFKIINDTFGHSAGDGLLIQLCGLIQKSVRSRDTLARLGGDEFGLLMEHCTMNDAVQTANHLRKRINEFRFLWNDRVLTVGISIGIARIDAGSGSVSDLMKAADSACYMAKDDGRNRVRIYQDTDMETEFRKTSMHWAAGIQEALANDELYLVRQPIQDLQSNDNGRELFELLLRMTDEQGNLVSATAMLSAAERYGLITKVDEWVFRTACKTVCSDPAMLQKSTLCSINLSGPSVSDMDFLYFVERTIDEYGIPPGKICFEITETAAIKNLSRAILFMERLRSRGFYFALDDFGTGLSSFTYLKELPVDYIKIDGSFVRDITNDPTDLALVKTINELGHVFGKRTIAEFVESPEILERIRKLGIDYAQGYHIGMPGAVAYKPRLRIVK